MKQTANGKCSICGQPLAEGSKNFCKKHWEASNTRCFENARRRAGIPLDAPKYKNYNKYNKKVDKLPL